MALEYRPVDRDQQFLLPPDMRDWLPPEHLVWFVLDVVDQLDTSAFHARARLGGVGRQGYDPDMLLALLVYAYCRGVRSSRQIERACRSDVAFMVLCARDAPDHSRIARFRAEHEQALEDLFAQVLVLCARAGLGRVGLVHLDGTKIAANASASASRTEDTLRKMVQDMLTEAGQVDAAEDELFGEDAGDEVPAELADRTSRQARVRAALEQIEAEKAARAREHQAKEEERGAKLKARAERARAALAEHEERRERYAQRVAAGHRPGGARPLPPQESREGRRLLTQIQRYEDHQAGVGRKEMIPTAAMRRANTTDPDSRFMQTRKGFVQGYNCQVLAADDGLVLATFIGQVSPDTTFLVPGMAAALAAVDLMAQATGQDLSIGTLVADAGYATRANFSAPGPDRLINIGKERDRRSAPVAPSSDAAAPSPEADPWVAMRQRLATPEGAQTYRRRGAVVEPVNGHLKDRRGLRRFARRGLTAVRSELAFAAAVTNLMKLFTTSTATATA